MYRQQKQQNFDSCVNTRHFENETSIVQGSFTPLVHNTTMIYMSTSSISFSMEKNKRERESKETNRLREGAMQFLLTFR